jgi:hypothetical protein
LKFKYVVYKITFPNDKIYIGKDIGGEGHSLCYFGSWDSSIVEADFTREQLADFRIIKQILFESDDKNETTQKESELIRLYDSSNPSVGYNRTHRKRKSDA